MMIIRSLLVAGHILVMALPAKAEWTGSDIYRECTSSDGTAKVGCAAYTAGFMMGLDAGKYYPLSRYCPPSGITGSQVRMIIVKYLENHPERLHVDGGTLAVEALFAAFPCHQRN